MKDNIIDLTKIVKNKKAEVEEARIDMKQALMNIGFNHTYYADGLISLAELKVALTVDFDKALASLVFLELSGKS
jgi:hypothetical protein